MAEVLHDNLEDFVFELHDIPVEQRGDVVLRISETEDVINDFTTNVTLIAGFVAGNDVIELVYDCGVEYRGSPAKSVGRQNVLEVSELLKDHCRTLGIAVKGGRYLSGQGRDDQVAREASPQGA